MTSPSPTSPHTTTKRIKSTLIQKTEQKLINDKTRFLEGSVRGLKG